MDFRDSFVCESETIKSAIVAIDKSHAGIAIVVNKDFRLIGVVTDTDIRKCILSGRSLESPVSKIVNRNPVIATTDMSKKEILELAQKTLKLQIPVVDSNGIVVGLEFLSHLISENKKSNWVVIMAGGYGRRLKPLTDNVPKPMLEVGEKPILHNIIDSFKEFGFHKFLISTHYKPESIMSYFGDGSKYNTEIKYLEEKKGLGTAGALGLIPKSILSNEPLLMMNADLLTKINFNSLLDFHNNEGNDLTVCIKEKDYQVPYGVIEFDGKKLKDIVEKPTHSFFINAGIYAFNQEIIEHLPGNCYLDMPNLIKQIIAEGLKVGCFPVREYWMDIGKLEDYNLACLDHNKNSEC